MDKSKGDFDLDYESLFDEACELVATSYKKDSIIHPDPLNEWANRSSLHQKALKEAQEIWLGVGQIKELPWLSKEEISDFTKDSDSGKSEKIPLSSGILSFGGKKSHFSRLAIVATLFIFCVMPLIYVFDNEGTSYPPSISKSNQPQEYKTSVGQHHLVSLEDGSTVTIGAKSKIKVLYSNSKRLVKLEEGEASFDVTKDQNRQFIVDSGTIKLTAIGTEFNVSKTSKATIVAVAEGIVEAKENVVLSTEKSSRSPKNSPLLLSEGERATYSLEQGLTALDPVDPKLIGAWKSGNLYFISSDLSSVISSVNRYYTKNIVILNESITKLKYSGTVKTDKIEEWLEALKAAFSLESEILDEQTILLTLKDKPA